MFANVPAMKLFCFRDQTTSHNDIWKHLCFFADVFPVNLPRLVLPSFAYRFKESTIAIAWFQSSFGHPLGFCVCSGCEIIQKCVIQIFWCVVRCASIASVAFQIMRTLCIHDHSGIGLVHISCLVVAFTKVGCRFAAFYTRSRSRVYNQVVQIILMIMVMISSKAIGYMVPTYKSEMVNPD